MLLFVDVAGAGGASTAKVSAAVFPASLAAAETAIFEVFVPHNFL